MDNKDSNKKENEKRGVLICTSSSRANEMIKLRRDNTIFGREKGDVIIEDGEVSATHCQIQNIKGEYHIFDMNSTNGTFVNGDRIVKAKLSVSDEIIIGNTQFRFELREEKEVRHIPTIFQGKKTKNQSTNSIVDTLIESELRTTKWNTIKMNITYSGGKNEVIELRQKIIFIGRASSFGQFEKDTEISRKHLLIKLNDTGEIFIEDQGSTNGTFLNGKKINGMHPITPHDTVKIGGTLLKIEPLAA